MKTSFIDYDSFNSSKVHRVNEYSPPNGDKITFFTPIYSYTNKSKYPLTFRTKFIDLNMDPFKYIKEDSKKFISIDTNDQSVNHLYKPLYNIAQFTSTYVSGKSVNSKELGPILANYDSHDQPDKKYDKTLTLNLQLPMKPIKFYFWEKGNKITSTIYNYNISKKYDPVEEYHSCELKDIARFITKGKQARFILEPRFWLLENGSYGTKLYIKYMEIKYKDQIINSKLEQDKEELYEKITSVEI